MGNSIGYRGNPIVHAAVARQAEWQAADLAAAVKALADAEAEVAEAARKEADAALVLPITRRGKASHKSTQETKP